jgi:hypothetical protein
VSEPTDAPTTDTTDDSRTDVKPELNKLLDLAVTHPEIGPPLAALAFKIGQADFGKRVVRMGLDSDTLGLEYYFVAANAARRQGQHDEVLRLAVEAVRAFVATADDALAADDHNRLLHLVRLGFSTLLFDRKDPTGAPDFVRGLSETMPALEARMGTDPFFRTLLAQTIWYEDRERSEAEWDRAVALGDADLVWNARGTWYKDAEGDPDRAERAYRRGLEVAPGNALLLHNLGQLLVDKAARPDVGDETWRLLDEAEQHLRNALRVECPGGLRRHIHSTRDRLVDLRASLPPRPGRGEGGRQRPGGPADRRRKGPPRDQQRRDRQSSGPPRRDGGSPPRRDGGSPPRRDDRRDEPRDRGPRRERRDQPPNDKFLMQGKVNLGEMILAKLRDQESNKG